VAAVTEAAARLRLSLGVAPPGALLTLVQEIGRRIAVVDLGDAGPMDPVLLRVEWDRAPQRFNGCRQAWWLEERGPALDVPPSRHPELALSPHRDVVDAAVSRGIRARIVPHAEVEPESAPVAPFVRERLRRARGLGEGLLVEDASGRWTWNGSVEVDRALIATTLAAAAAAYLSSPEAAVRAMAWGCPVVAPSGTLAVTGATPGVDSVADDGTDPAEQLRRLAADPHRTAALSRSARARYEAAHSVSACADDVMRALGLTALWYPSHLQMRLEELDSRRGATQRHRFDEMVSPIVQHGGH
jgi:hypothetical protein